MPSNVNKPALMIPDLESRCLTTPKEFLIKMQNEPTISQLSKQPSLFTFIGAMFIKLNTLAGIKHNITEQDMADIKNLVFIYFKGLSLADIYKAFELERFGMYDNKTDHFQLFNSVYVSEVLKKYQKWKQSKKIELNITKESVPLFPEMSEVQKKKIAYDSLCATYDRIKKDGFDEMAWLIYDRIKNKITLSAEERKNIYKQEEVRYINELKQSGSKSDYQKAIGFPKHAQTGRYDSAVQTQCKIRMVLEFVKPHLATLETFLNAIGYEG